MAGICPGHFCFTRREERSPDGAKRNPGASLSAERASPHPASLHAGYAYCFHVVNAVLNARSPGVPFSTARMARRPSV